MYCSLRLTTGCHQKSAAPHPTQVPATSSSPLDAADLRVGGIALRYVEIGLAQGWPEMRRPRTLQEYLKVTCG